MNAAWELIDTSTLAAEIEDTDLGVGYTTVEAGLGVRLSNTIVSLCLHIDGGDGGAVSKDSILRTVVAKIVAIAISRLAPGSDMTHLVLAVAVASCGTASHCGGVVCG